MIANIKNKYDSLNPNCQTLWIAAIKLIIATIIQTCFIVSVKVKILANNQFSIKINNMFNNYFNFTPSLSFFGMGRGAGFFFNSLDFLTGAND